jgi:hypothetical protein
MYVWNPKVTTAAPMYIPTINTAQRGMGRILVAPERWTRSRASVSCDELTGRTISECLVRVNLVLLQLTKAAATELPAPQGDWPPGVPNRLATRIGDWKVEGLRR